jgi:hypothetical protein
MKAITCAGAIEELYDDHSGENPVRVQVRSDTMLFETYVAPEVGSKLKVGQKMKVILADAD